MMPGGRFSSLLLPANVAMRADFRWTAITCSASVSDSLRPAGGEVQPQAERGRRGPAWKDLAGTDGKTIPWPITGREGRRARLHLQPIARCGVLRDRSRSWCADFGPKGVSSSRSTPASRRQPRQDEAPREGEEFNFEYLQDRRRSRRRISAPPSRRTSSCSTGRGRSPNGGVRRQHGPGEGRRRGTFATRSTRCLPGSARRFGKRGSSDCGIQYE